MAHKLTEGQKEKLINEVIERMEIDINQGDVEAIDELLKFCPIKNLIAFLPDEDMHRWLDARAGKFTDEEIADYKDTWGQSHTEICANLEYDEDTSDDLLMVDYFWVAEDKKWYPKENSFYSIREEEIADYLRHNS